MKNTLLILLIFSIFQVVTSCKEKVTNSDLNIEKSNNIIKPENNNNNDTKDKNHLNKKEIRFVSAENGLNFRDKPKGTILGKFEYNKELEIVKRTGILEQIDDDGKTKKGEWTGVLNNKDTVYVFSGFLTITKDVSYIKEENDHYVEPDNLVISKISQYQDTIAIKEIEAKDFFDVTSVTKKEFDNVYSKHINWVELNSLVKKDSVLTIDCLGNKKILFIDKNTKYDEEIELFYYNKTFEKINSHLIVMSGWEWGEYYLVNYNNCRKIKVNGFPVFNSNFSKAFCINYNLGDERININSYDGENMNTIYSFETYQVPNRSILANNGDFYVELYSEWNDGEMQKQSIQYFKLELLNEK